MSSNDPIIPAPWNSASLLTQQGSPPDHVAKVERLTAALKVHARDCGLDLVGVVPAVSPPGFPLFQEWLARGFAGEMHYLPRRERAYSDPGAILPGVRCVVMVAISYDVIAKEPPPDAGTSPTAGRIARYAQNGSDYHDILKARLRRLADWLHSQRPGCRTRNVVDTAPLLERDFARLAGFGWFGKNTMLIHKRAGSYLLLGALLTDVELTADEPHHTAHCGTCTRCLEACPTEAFPEPHVLDARRCIAYLTIELSGPIPREFRTDIGDWLFGCDICQEVCPWNRKANKTADPEFQPRDDFHTLEAAALLSMTEAEFDARFEKSPLERPGSSGLKRNAAIVLGNSRDPRAVPELGAAITDADPVVRGAVAWALGQLGGTAALEVLKHQLTVEVDANVLDEIRAALVQHRVGSQ